jgi:hypothetical protein
MCGYSVLGRGRGCSSTVCTGGRVRCAVLLLWCVTAVLVGWCFRQEWCALHKGEQVLFHARGVYGACVIRFVL